RQVASYPPTNLGRTLTERHRASVSPRSRRALPRKRAACREGLTANSASLHGGPPTPRNSMPAPGRRRVLHPGQVAATRSVTCLPGLTALPVLCAPSAL